MLHLVNKFFRLKLIFKIDFKKEYHIIEKMNENIEANIKPNFIEMQLNNNADNILDYIYEYAFEEVYQCGLEMLYMHIDNHPLDIAEENFESIIKDSTNAMLGIHIQTLFQETLGKESLSIASETIIEFCMKEFYTTLYPRRAYYKSHIRKVVNNNVLEKKIHIIDNMFQPEQRTKAWYEYRHNLITASSAGKVFETKSSQNQLIFEKCSPIQNRENMFVNTNSPLHWGQKYEPVSTSLYEYLYDTTIKDYGCLQHPVYKFLGASPDGINVDKNNKRYGRMLEIKNIVNREINGNPKKIYWIQMQLQMEVCNLNECDFLECRFKEYESEEEFREDGTFNYNNNDKMKGIILHFQQDGKPVYEYMPINCSEQDYLVWKEEKMKLELTFIKTIYWRLEQYSCVLVLRNKLWFAEAIKHIESTWNTITYEKEHGYEHRAPKKKKPVEVKCLIDLDENEELKNDDEINNYSTPSETPIIFKIRTKSIDETKKEEDGSLS